MSIADNLHDALFRLRVEPALRFEFLNEAISILTGYPRSDFINNPGLLAKIIDPQDREKFNAILTDSVDGGCILRVVCRDGYVRPFEFHYVHVLDRSRKIVAVEGLIYKRVADEVEPVQGSEISVDERIQYFAEKLKIAGHINQTLAERLSLKDIYILLSDSLMSLFPDLRMITIARYHPEVQQLSCVAAVLENEAVDISQFPPVALEPPGKGTQSEAVHTRRPVIIANLAERYKQIRKVVLVDKEGSDTGTSTQSALCVPMLSKGEVLGVIQLQSPIVNRFTVEDGQMVSIVANTAAVAMETAMLVDNLQNSRVAIQEAYDATLAGMMRSLELRDQETEGHTQRVAELTVRLGGVLRLNDTQLVDLRRGALLHDIGKIGVPDAILRKPGPLTDEEWVKMRSHAENGYRILMDVPFLRNSMEVVRYHHEKWDGSGYPLGLKGTDIPLAARIFAIVDVWDALTSDRPYRKAWPREKVLAHIRENSGTHFDPALVDAFMKLAEQMPTALSLAIPAQIS